MPRSIVNSRHALIKAAFLGVVLGILAVCTDALLGGGWSWRMVPLGLLIVAIAVISAAVARRSRRNSSDSPDT